MSKNCRTALYLLVVILFVLTSNRTVAQELTSPANSRHKVGFVTGYGAQNFGRLLSLDVDYRYKVLFFQAQYYYSFLNKGKWSLELLVQPQFNKTKLGRVDDLVGEQSGYELGIDFGVLARKYLFNKFMSVYASLAVGPHYISKSLPRQAKGFIISDNLFGGVTFRISHDTYIDLRGGFRHLSNASLKQPNGGVNVVMLSMGFFVTL